MQESGPPQDKIERSDDGKGTCLMKTPVDKKVLRLLRPCVLDTSPGLPPIPAPCSEISSFFAWVSLPVVESDVASTCFSSRTLPHYIHNQSTYSSRIVPGPHGIGIVTCIIDEWTFSQRNRNKGHTKTLNWKTTLDGASVCRKAGKTNQQISWCASKDLCPT